MGGGELLSTQKGKALHYFLILILMERGGQINCHCSRWTNSFLEFYISNQYKHYLFGNLIYSLCFLSYRMWKCKDCSLSFSGKSELLQHYRLDHRFHGRHRPYPCIHENCPCSSSTWNGLQKHLARNHLSQESTQKASSFKCYICDHNQLSTEYDFFQHINQHLKRNELVSCMFNGCSYKSNIYGSFKTHKWRKHNSCTVKDLKSGIFVTSSISCYPTDSLNSELDEPTITDSRDFEKEVELKLASLLLKLEHTYLVSSTAVNELLEELHLIGTVSVRVSQNTISQFLRDNNCHVEASVVEASHCTLFFKPNSKSNSETRSIVYFLEAQIIL